MKKDFRERVRFTFLKLMKKNRFFRLPLLCCMVIILSVYYTLLHFVSNQKKYACVGVLLLFFILSSSFTYPATNDKGGFVSGSAIDEWQTAQTYEITNTERTEESGAVLAAEPLTHENIGVLEDEAVLDGYEDAEIHGMEDSDQYTIDDILDANSNSIYDKEKGNKAENEPEDNLLFDAQDWRYVLINKQHPIPDDYSFELVTIKGSMQCDSRIRDELLEMLRAAKKDGINLVIRSPYRDMSRQEYLFGKKIKVYMGNGMSYMEAYKTASQAVTVPGASEHQIGLAIDITSDDYAVLNEGFGDTEAGKWLAENSSEFGFILRYPKGKEYITSIEYEPWHFRYVGKEAAKVIGQKGITLEEFVESYL